MGIVYDVPPGSEPEKINFFIKLWNTFNQFDRFMKFTVITMVLIIIATPSITTGYLLLNQHAAFDNLLKNSSLEDFSNGRLSNWNFHLQGIGKGTITQDATDKQDGNASAKITVTTASPHSWDVQLEQSGLILGPRSYTLTFWAKADTNRMITAAIQQTSSPFHVYFQQTIPLGTSWQQETLTFTMPLADPNAAVRFNFAQTAGTVWLDNVIFEQTPPTVVGESCPALNINIANTYAFVSRQGNLLCLNGKRFRFGGANIYWLGMLGNYTYPSTQRVDTVLNDASQMGVTVVRSMSLGMSVGSPQSIEPSLGVFNDTAFKSIDYAIWDAHQHNLRLVIPLVDAFNHGYYTGGSNTFTAWRNDANQDDFYTNATLIQDYENYIAHILNHVNQYTGITLKNDPTIMAWATGNELTVQSGQWGPIQDAWTQTIASFIKSLAPQQLVEDGHFAEGNANKQLTTSQLQLPSVDLYTDHFYPPYISVMQTNAGLAQQYGKAYYVGEFDWTDIDATPAQGSIAQDSITSEDGKYSAHISITQSNPNLLDYYFAQLSSDVFAVVQGAPLTISFYAKATNNNVIQALLQESSYPYNVFNTGQDALKTIQLSSSWKQYSFTLTPAYSFSSVKLRFNLAANTGNIWIDNVAVSTGSTNLIQDGSFESLFGTFPIPWTFQIKNIQANTLSQLLPAIQSAQNITGALFWSLFDNNPGGDIYSLHFGNPNLDANISNEQQRIQQLTQFNQNLSLTTQLQIR